MKKSATNAVISFITAATIGLTFIQPTIIHQLVMWVSGMFAVLVTLALFIISNAQQAPTTVKQNGDDYLINMTRSYRLVGYSDENIATALNADIDVIKAIP